MRRGQHRHHHRRGRKLHVQIYWAFLGMVVVSIVIAAGIARLLHPEAERGLPPFVRAAGELLVDDLGQGEAMAAELARRADKLGVEASLWDAQGALLTRTGREHSRPAAQLQWGEHGGPLGVSMQLPDGRSLAVTSIEPRPRHPLPVLVMALLALAALMGVVSYPLARRITRRLSRLQAGVERFGAGELQSRVEVHGNDEVAEVARAFNAAAARIEGLVTQQQRMLASASHELRAPLARLRMAHELLLDDADALDESRRAQLLADVEADIAELDTLVADVLMAARLEQPERAGELSEIDLSAIVTREAQRASATAHVDDGVQVRGDAVMLGRMLRNLLDNARAHGGDEPQVEVALESTTAGATLRVRDRGPGVPEADRERIFEPFYRPQGHAETRDGGVGLGLSLVRQIAERHGATVRHHARDGGGSEFEVVFDHAM